jgi:bacterioferritin
MEDIQSKLKAIEKYRYHITLIQNRYIGEFHIKLFEELYEKYGDKY